MFQKSQDPNKVFSSSGSSKLKSPTFWILNLFSLPFSEIEVKALDLFLLKDFCYCHAHVQHQIQSLVDFPCVASCNWTWIPHLMINSFIFKYESTGFMFFYLLRISLWDSNFLVVVFVALTDLWNPEVNRIKATK